MCYENWVVLQQIWREKSCPAQNTIITKKLIISLDVCCAHICMRHHNVHIPTPCFVGGMADDVIVTDC